MTALDAASAVTRGHGLRGMAIVVWSAFAHGITDEEEIEWLRQHTP